MLGSISAKVQRRKLVEVPGDPFHSRRRRLTSRSPFPLARPTRTRTPSQHWSWMARMARCRSAPSQRVSSS